jgi:hypothetical protein
MPQLTMNQLKLGTVIEHDGEPRLDPSPTLP